MKSLESLAIINEAYIFNLKKLASINRASLFPDFILVISVSCVNFIFNSQLYTISSIPVVSAATFARPYFPLTAKIPKLPLPHLVARRSPPYTRAEDA